MEAVTTQVWVIEGGEVHVHAYGYTERYAALGGVVKALGSGTDFALESATVSLLRDDLQLIPASIDLSKRTVAIIKQNLAWAFLYNCVGVVAAISGWLNPLWAAAAMLFSSLSVVGNSLRLKSERGKTFQNFLNILIPWREPTN